MARDSRKAAVEGIEASTSTTSISVSSVPFPYSNAGSTVDTLSTSSEDEEGFTSQRKAITKVIRTTGMRRKRSAESHADDVEPASKRHAVMKTVYVGIPVWFANVSGYCLILIGFLDRLSQDFEGQGQGEDTFQPG